MLSGLLRCACCGAGMSIKDRDHGRVRLVCTHAKEAQSCENRQPYYLDAIECAVVGGLREKPADKAAIELYVWAYNDERQKAAADLIGSRGKLETRLARAEAEHERTLDFMIKGHLPEEPGVVGLKELKPEIASLKEQLAGMEKPPVIVALHSNALRDYLAAIERLDHAIGIGADDGAESRAALRALVEKVVVHPPTNEGVAIEVSGRLSDIVGPQAFPAGKLRGVRW